MARRTRVTFASCNLFNINLPRLSVYSDRDGWDQEAYDKKVAWTEQMINTVDADVWGFQELWHARALKDVFNEVELEGEHALLVSPGHVGESIVCTGAVREDIQVDEPEWIHNSPEKFRLGSGGDDPQTGGIAVSIQSFSRPVLHFRVKPRANGKTVSVYVAHFKSKAPSKIYLEDWYRSDKNYYTRYSSALGAAASTIRRTAEAGALPMMLTEEMKGNESPVVVLGDLNDSQHSNTINILTGQPNY
jgi:endonuclease/exonuclease/phosphatase family metal-dependent hydrolase